MLTSFVRDQRTLLAALAGSWLECGAVEFGIWEADRPLARWTRSQDAAAGEAGLLSHPISGRNSSGAQLRVLGPLNACTAARLAAEAALLHRLIQQEEDVEALTAELVETQDQLLALYDLAKATRKHLAIPETLRSLAEAAARLIKCECAAVVLLGEAGEIYSGEEGWQPPGGSVERVASLVRRALAEGRDLSDAGLGEEGHAGLPPRNVYVTPIRARAGWSGGLALANRGDGVLRSPERKLARAVAEHAGAQIENVLLYQESLRNARLETEMDLARSVQMRLLPQRLPTVPGLDLWAGSRPAMQVGGDLYDFVALPGGGLTCAVGDVSGKGVAAALLMSMTHAVFRSAAGVTPLSPVAMIAHVNTHLYDDFGAVASFVTMFVAQFEPRTRRLAYANAGHAPVMYCPAGQPATLLEADGPAIGILPVILSENQLLTLAPGDVLVAATDGFNEAQNAAGAMFGIDRMLRSVETLASQSARDIGLGLHQAVDLFADGRPADDDQTVVVLKGAAV